MRAAPTRAGGVAMTDDDYWRQRDHDAFTRGIELMRKEGGHARELIMTSLAKQSFAESGELACYYLQCQRLALKPWQPAPCYASARLDGPDDGSQGWKNAELLAHRLQTAGLSRFEPDPLGALERVERERVA
jgi:hypothetical protein